MKEECPDGQGAAGPRYTSVRLDPKEVYLGGRRAVLSGGGQGGEGGRFLTEADWEACIQVKPSRHVLLFWQGGRDWRATADEADVPRGNRIEIECTLTETGWCWQRQSGVCPSSGAGPSSRLAGPESKPGSEHRSSSVSQGRGQSDMATRQVEFCRWWRVCTGW